MDQEELNAIRKYHEKWFSRAQNVFTKEELESLKKKCKHNNVLNFDSFKAAIIKKENS